MGPYQYKTRVTRLRQKGARMHEFGERVLHEGSYGDDVMALQVRGRLCCRARRARWRP